MRGSVAPSAEVQVEIDKLLGNGLVDDPQKMLGELARPGARLIIQRAVEDEFDTWLGQPRYERRPERERGGSARSCTSAWSVLSPISLDVSLVVLFLDAICLPVRPSPGESV